MATKHKPQVGKNSHKNREGGGGGMGHPSKIPHPSNQNPGGSVPVGKGIMMGGCEGGGSTKGSR